MIVGKKNPIVDLYNENFSDTDETENTQKHYCKIDNDINLFDNMPSDSIEK
jgi:hypothetical protein